MSLLQELGAKLRATSEELPTGLMAVAMERLRTATEMLDWVRQESANDIGVPTLGNATEHAHQATAALRRAQEAISAYLTAIGLAGEPGSQPRDDWRAGLAEPPEGAAPPSGEQRAGQPPEQGTWWGKRVEEITGESPAEPDKTGDSKADTAELLRRVAAGVRSGDRARLGRDLHAVPAAAGLGLSAVTPPVLHKLAADLLGHEPRPEDLERLRSATSGRVKSLLPGAPPEVLDTVLARICRAPAPQGPPAHPTDSAVTSGVLTGVLLARLGRDPSTLDPSAPEPVQQRPEKDA